MHIKSVNIRVIRVTISLIVINGYICQHYIFQTYKYAENIPRSKENQLEIDSAARRIAVRCSQWFC